MTGVLPDSEIRRLSTTGFFVSAFRDRVPPGADITAPRKMITPLADGEDRPKTISYGTTSYGYDMRLGTELRLFVADRVIDPKDFEPDDLTVLTVREEAPSGRFFTLPPQSFALGVSLEHFDIPRDVIGICTGKSTYARSGLYLNCTPLEPGWRGHLTLELFNASPTRLRVYVGEGIGQIVFHQAGHPCEVSYADRSGKYQDQERRVVFPIVR